MAQRPKIRADYRQDATYLQRLSIAIEDDPKADQKFKRAAISGLSVLIRLFLDEDLRRTMGKKDD